MLDPLTLQKLEKLGSIQHFHTGETILAENTYIRSIPMVIRGTLRVMRTDEEGREILLYYVREGESCIMSVLGSLTHDMSKIKAIAEEDTDILLIPVSKANELIKTDPRWIDYVFRLYYKRFEELLDLVNSIAFQKLDQRILDLLRKKSQLSGSPEIQITHQQLADELGSSREVISRLLKHMENKKIIRLSRNRILLRDKSHQH
ncbi:MAG: Crp/Fnr family transcriptional regulator [Chitinophagales bacterium]|nr:MAG: Crp/Fnr family transcriptional regulator [Chitinophagales bacterium]